MPDKEKEKPVLFSSSAAKRIIDATTAFEGGLNFGPPRRPTAYRPAPNGGRIAKSTTTIPARTSVTVPGKGSMQLYTFKPTTLTLDTSITYDVYNPFSTAVATGVTIEVSLIDGYWFVTGADCV